MHLANNHPLCTVNHKSRIVGHERNVTHIDILFFNVFYRFGASFLINIKHNQTKRHLQRRRKRHVTLLTFFHVIFRLFKFVRNKFKCRPLRKISNRKNRGENGLKTFIGAPTIWSIDHQKLIIGPFLNLDEVGHLSHFCD